MAYITFQPSDYFNTVLYTGNGSSQNITGVGFDPDWIWTKTRTCRNASTILIKLEVLLKELQLLNNCWAKIQKVIKVLITDGFCLVSKWKSK